MARRPRMVVEDGLYHVYNRIASGEHVSADPEEAREIVELIRDVRKSARFAHSVILFA